MEGTGNRAGHLIKAGAIGTCLRTHFLHGRTRASWRVVRRELAELFPESMPHSREAVVRMAQAAAAVAREMYRRPPDWQPTGVPDARRLIRDRNRVR